MKNSVISNPPAIRVRPVNAAIKHYYKRRDDVTIAQGKKPRAGARRAEQIQLVKDLLTLVIEPQMKAGRKGLDLSDTKLKEVLGISEHQAERLRALAQDIGLIFIPPGGKQKKLGDYPIWLINFKFTNVQRGKKSGQTKTKKVIKNPTYVPRYYQMRSKAQSMIAAGLREAGTTMCTRDFMIASYGLLNDMFHEAGITRADLRIKKPKKKD